VTFGAKSLGCEKQLNKILCRKNDNDTFMTVENVNRITVFVA